MREIILFLLRMVLGASMFLLTAFLILIEVLIITIMTLWNFRFPKHYTRYSSNIPIFAPTEQASRFTIELFTKKL